MSHSVTEADIAAWQKTLDHRAERLRAATNAQRIFDGCYHLALWARDVLPECNAWTDLRAETLPWLAKLLDPRFRAWVIDSDEYTTSTLEDLKYNTVESLMEDCQAIVDEWEDILYCENEA
jgi:hypothetical protein